MENAKETPVERLAGDLTSCHQSFRKYRWQRTQSSGSDVWFGVSGSMWVRVGLDDGSLAQLYCARSVPGRAPTKAIMTKRS